MKEVEEIVIKSLLKKRTVFLFGEITAEKLTELRENLLYLSLQSNKEIKMVINTGGGLCRSGLHFFDFLKLYKPPIIGFVARECNSMGVVVLQACERRLAAQHSRFLIHSLSSTIHLEFSQSDKELWEKFRKEVRSLRRYQQFINNILLERTKLSKEKLQELIKDGDNNIDIPAEDAKEMGLIDDIARGFELDLTN